MMKESMRTNNAVNFFRVYLLLILATVVFMFSPVARAAPLNLVPMAPDILAGYIDVTYDAGTDVFSASGFAASFDDDGVGDPFSIPEAATSANYFISAEIDASGNLISGDVTINGTVGGLGYNSGTLLTGDLTDLGFPEPGNGDTLEFVFDVTGGDAAGLYGPEGGIILSLGALSDYSGSFESSFDNNFGISGMGQGVSDNFKVIPASPIPIPSAVWLLGSAFVGLVGFRRKFGKR